jgi:DNA-binding response OmpR family regulator
MKMSRPITILVVDDDQEIGFMMKLMLEHKGYSVIIEERAERTEEILRNHSVDLVILDMLIAGVKGTDVSVRLKNNAATANIPIMMITALPDAEQTCREAGADDFIYKPFEMQHLLSKINQLVKRHHNFT